VKALAEIRQESFDVCHVGDAREAEPDAGEHFVVEQGGMRGLRSGERGGPAAIVEEGERLIGRLEDGGDGAVWSYRLAE